MFIKIVFSLHKLLTFVMFLFTTHLCAANETKREKIWYLFLIIRHDRHETASSCCWLLVVACWLVAAKQAKIVIKLQWKRNAILQLNAKCAKRCASGTPAGQSTSTSSSNSSKSKVNIKHKIFNYKQNLWKSKTRECRQRDRGWAM